MKIRELASSVGKGLFAGAAGTAAMTVSSTLAATKWGAKEVGIDAFHHLVYAGATGVAYEQLDR
jgi:hypothetical protein